MWTEEDAAAHATGLPYPVAPSPPSACRTVDSSLSSVCCDSSDGEGLNMTGWVLIVSVY